MTRQLVFDLDGTLVGCRERQVAVMQHALNILGEPGAFDVREFWDLKRRGANNEGALTALGMPADVARKAATKWYEQIEDACWLPLDRLFPDTFFVLARLRDRGYRASLLSARRDSEAARAQIGTLGLSDWLSEAVFVSPGSALESKTAFLRAAAPAGYVGDTELDARAARLSGTPFAAVSGGQRCTEFLVESGIATVSPTLADAVALLIGRE